jgi:hypothetical chaperone protein
VGHDALRQFSVTGGWQSRLLIGIKSDLSDPNMTGTEAPWGEVLQIEDLVAMVLGHLKTVADRHTGFDVQRLVIGHPVVWVGAEGPGFERRQDLARKRLEQAADIAGFREVVLLDEPTAALMTEEPRDAVMVAVDFGGGTFDVSVIEISDGRWEVLDTQGAAIGGELFNAQLFDLKLAEPLGLSRSYRVNGKLLPVPYPLMRLRTLAGTLQMAGDSRTRTALDLMYLDPASKKLRMVEEIALEGHAVPFHDAVERGKVGLSSSTKTQLTFQRPRVALDEAVTRDEFESCIEPNLWVVREQILLALTRSGLEPADVDLVVRTGGSSQLPIFIEMLENIFGTERVQARDAFATVALGLGVHGIDHWGSG